MKLLRFILLWIAAFELPLHSTAQNCPYRYFEQPLIQLPCNPYAGDSVLRIACRVDGPLNDEFEILWFKHLTGSSEAERLRDNGGKIKLMEPERTSSRKSSLLLVSNLSEQDAGLYWCQINITRRGSDETEVGLLERSNELLLNSQQSYAGQSSCPERMDLSSTEGQQPTECITFESTPPPGQEGRTSNPPDPAATTFTEAALDATTEEGDESSSSNNQLVALFSVLGVIVVFSAIIITLTIVIVVLYRKRYGHMDFKKTADRNSSSNPYSGFTHEQKGRSVSSQSNLTTRSDRSDSRLASSSLNNSTTTSPAPLVSSVSDEQPYSRLIHTPHSHNPLPPRSPPLPGDYSKLEQSNIEPPPRPPKPSSMKSTSRTPPPPPIIQNRRSQNRNDFSDRDIERGGQSSDEQPPVNIYRTMDGRSNRDSYEYDYARQSGGWKVKSPDNNEGGRGLFDDPEYSPLNEGAGKGKKKKIEVIDPRYVGDYERSPTYTCPTVQVNVQDVDPKYRGNYEWDPTYVPKPPPRRASFGVDTNRKIPKPTEVLQRRKSLEADAMHKYSGDYERNPNYVPPPLRNGSVKTQQGIKLENKYVGNYERDPIYMANKLAGKNNAEYSTPSQQSGPAGDQTWAELVPPHIPSEYKALEESLIDPPQQYATLTPDLSDPQTSAV